MPLLLHIDTATTVGSVSLSENGKIISEKISHKQRSHAAVIAPFIKDILEDADVKKSQIDAISISAGPGSYTGLRVATSTAKGLCYALDIPLIAISTLEMMAYGMRAETSFSKDSLLVPMIDARRKEVFTAIYNDQLEEKEGPQAAILSEGFLEKYSGHSIIVAGTGAAKAKDILKQDHLIFPDYFCKSSHLISLAEKRYGKKIFEDTAYFEPFYLKSVYLPQSNK